MTAEQLNHDVRTGAPVWIDLSTHDPDGAARFYHSLFGWDFQDQGEAFGHYQMVIGPHGPLAGAMSTLMSPDGPTDTPQAPTAWTVYLGAADIEATAAKLTQAGGGLLVPPMTVPGSGIMAVASAPSGAVLGLWQPQPFSGFTLDMSPGSPVWFESASTSFDADLAFYEEVFGWDEQLMPGSGPRYVTNGANEQAACGLYDASGLNPPVESHWRVYFAVADCDAACDRVLQLGGQVLDAPIDSPYGRVAGVADPQGARFQINAAPPRG